MVPFKKLTKLQGGEGVPVQGLGRISPGSGIVDLPSVTVVSPVRESLECQAYSDVNKQEFRQKPITRNNLAQNVQNSQSFRQKIALLV